jgi:anti-sigma B factor antagonist
METFRVKAVPGNNTCTLMLSGEVDLAGAPDITELGTISLNESGMSTLIVDLTAVTFIDSTAIGAFVHLRNLADEGGKKFVLANAPDRVLRVIQIAGLDAVFDLQTTSEVAQN